MNDKLLEYLIDPVKGKILLEINYAGKASVKDLCDRCKNIPRSTMYRHLAKLEKEGFIEVVETKQKRGTVEKTYSLIKSAFEPATAECPTGEQLLGFFINYCMNFITEFQIAFRAEDFDAEREKGVMGFTTAPVYATDDELKNTMEIIGRAISRLTENAAGPDRKFHSIGVIITPPKSD